jgi:flagellar hook assembly protein FlgD
VESRTAFELAMPTPNPASRGSEISFSIPQESQVQLRIFDVAGRQVRTLINGAMAAGPHTAKWDGADDAGLRVSPGIYMVQLTAPGETAHRKVTVVR